jgi:hypothetical protein
VAGFREVNDQRVDVAYDDQVYVMTGISSIATSKRLRKKDARTADDEFRRLRRSTVSVTDKTTEPMAIVERELPCAI